MLLWSPPRWNNTRPFSTDIRVAKNVLPTLAANNSLTPRREPHTHTPREKDRDHVEAKTCRSRVGCCCCCSGVEEQEENLKNFDQTILLFSV